MEYASIFMIIFAGAILLYAVLIAWTRDIRLIAKNRVVKIKGDKKLYALKIAKILAFTSIAPLLSGIIGLLSDSALLMIIALAAGLIICIRVGIKVFW
ncbi:MAG: hypothetical protein IJT21_10625 [Synergistaceae bacterium]|nr:hypothetical protein [Synergistaceae bacterium]